MWKNAISLTAILILFFVPIVGGEASKVSFNISNTGIIFSPSTNPTVPPDNSILFYDDFATTEVINGELTGWGDFQLIQRPETIDFSTDFYNSAGRSLKITAPGDLPSHRATSVIKSGRYDTEYWGSGSFYFPTDFTLTATKKWFDFCDPMFEYNQASSGTSVLIFGFQVLGNDLELVLMIQRTVSSYKVDFRTIGTGIHIPRGQWITLKYHVVRDETNGLIEAWYQGQKIIEYQGMTKYMQDQYNWIPIKHYTDAGETVKTVYYDNVVLSLEPI